MANSNRIPYTTYIAVNNTEAAQSLLDSYGFKQATNAVQLSNTLKYIVQNDVDKGFLNVVGLHPDKQMILDLFGSEKTSSADAVTPEMLNFCGCAADGTGSHKGKCGCKKCSKESTSSFEGCGACRNGRVRSEDLSADGNTSGLVTQADLQNAISQINNQPSTTHTNYQLLFGAAIIAVLAVVVLKSK